MENEFKESRLVKKISTFFVTSKKRKGVGDSLPFQPVFLWEGKMAMEMFEVKRIARYQSKNPDNYHRDDNTVELVVTLPEGKTQVELVEATKAFFSKEENKKLFYGKNVVILGRITTAMCLCIGHILAHICQTVSIFDPKINNTVLVIKH